MSKQKQIVGIYRITSPSGRVYIGKTKNMKERIKAYRSANIASKTILKSSILKYGWSAHKMELIHELPPDIEDSILNGYEILFIEQYKSNTNKYPKYKGMNMTYGGDGVVGYICTEDVKKKISENMKANFKPLKGELHPCFGKLGKDSNAYGFRHTEDAKKNIGLAQKDGKHNMAVKVKNVKTGEVFGCLKLAALSANIGYYSFKWQLSIGGNNNTDFVRV